MEESSFPEATENSLQDFPLVVIHYLCLRRRGKAAWPGDVKWVLQ